MLSGGTRHYFVARCSLQEIEAEVHFLICVMFIVYTLPASGTASGMETSSSVETGHRVI